jgi:hypothetical protein
MTIDERLGPQVEAWLDGSITVAGVHQAPRVLPADYGWHTSKRTMFFIGLALIFISAVLLRFIVRFELTATFTATPTLKLTVRRLWFWTSTHTITGHLGVHARMWYTTPLGFLYWRSGWSRRHGPLWGVWCETAPGAGRWLAGGLTELEAETVVEAISGRP